MQNPSKELNLLHQELVKFHEQMETEQDIKVWSKRSQKIKDLLLKTKSLLPSKTKKEQQRFLKLQRQLTTEKNTQEINDNWAGFEHIIVEIIGVFILPFSISTWLGISITGGLALIIGLIIWRKRTKKRSALMAKLKTIKRDVRYLSRVVEYEYLNRVEKK